MFSLTPSNSPCPTPAWNAVAVPSTPMARMKYAPRAIMLPTTAWTTGLLGFSST
jgi:hypothetical protein